MPRCSRTLGVAQQLLQSTSVIQSALHLGHKLFGHVDCNPPPLLPAVEDVTWMLLPRHTSRTILAHAGTAAKAQGAKQRRPKPRCFALQPANDIGRSFESGALHTVRVSESTRSCQAKHNTNTRRNALTSLAQSSEHPNTFTSFRRPHA